MRIPRLQTPQPSLPPSRLHRTMPRDPSQRPHSRVRAHLSNTTRSPPTPRDTSPLSTSLSPSTPRHPLTTHPRKATAVEHNTPYYPPHTEPHPTYPTKSTTADRPDTPAPPDTNPPQLPLHSLDLLPPPYATT
ncbi:hypothetical protein CesoFtcFv8_021423 [Champsocephalus esox]|uniref:Uncharacterized protein n=1 Tax=Champsocephalus esox TaxID=159716 RepID=A0AAN8BCX7_9TELE|nr:hypothetical protein CesoFtcFv8_021423 [Champsocephalus esox]